MLIDKEDAFECQGSAEGHSSQLIFSKTEVFRTVFQIKMFGDHGYLST